jgi:alanyl-tRNA synthetase
MGLERLTRLLQGVDSNYDTDLFQPLLHKMADIAGIAYGANPQSDVSLQVIADHARFCSVLIGDGILPNNEGRGYVLRRVLRRAARHGVLLGVQEPFLYAVAGTVIDELGGTYPELESRRAFIQETIKKEEERFGRTLSRGLALLDEEIATARREKRDRLTGEVVFKLYDTYGFPTDLTEDILRGKDMSYDRAAFDSFMREQSERARAAWQGSGQTAPAEVYSGIAARVQSEFNGYDTLTGSAAIDALLRDGAEVESVQEGDRVEVVVATTPFYAESGGQVGDAGEISGPAGRIEVEDTQKPVDGVIVHLGRVALGSLSRGDTVELAVDSEARAATVRNHSGTHLFHWALRQVLGPQVTQAGSLVAPDRLRFDFTHDDPLTEEQVVEIEDLVNGLILANEAGSVALKSYPQAIEDGAIAIFEEKYGDEVRVVSFGPSTELCGGTHARATGDIGSFRIVGQSAIGAGVRRVEAQTGIGVIEHARAEGRALRDVARLLRAPAGEVAERVRRLLDRQKQLERELEKTRAELRRGGAADPLHDVREQAGVKLVAAQVGDASAKELRGMTDELKQRLGSGIVLLVASQNGKVALALGVTKDLTGRFRAGDLIKPVAECVGGSGGGRPDFAQAGGTNQAGVERAIETFYALIS